MQQTPNANPGFEGNHKVQSSKFLAEPSGKAERNVQSLGRTQLAQMYFPYVLPQTAWQKLRSLLNEDPALSHLTTLRRRTFLPAEVNIIYQHLGQP